MYTVSFDDQSDAYPARDQAVAAAKSISDEHKITVEVSNDLLSETLVFRNGALESYVYETRPRGRKASN